MKDEVHVFNRKDIDIVCTLQRTSFDARVVSKAPFFSMKKTEVKQWCDFQQEGKV